MPRSPEVKAAIEKLASSYGVEEVLEVQQKIASSLKNLAIGGSALGLGLGGVALGRATADDPEPAYVSPAVAAALGVAAGYAGSKLPESLGSPSTPGYGQFDFTPDDLNMIMSAAKPSRRSY